MSEGKEVLIEWVINELCILILEECLKEGSKYCEKEHGWLGINEQINQYA